VIDFGATDFGATDFDALDLAALDLVAPGVGATAGVLPLAGAVRDAAVDAAADAGELAAVAVVAAFRRARAGGFFPCACA
jgi:hypothetical protein